MKERKKNSKNQIKATFLKRQTLAWSAAQQQKQHQK